MSSAIYILDRDLNLIVQRQYRHDLDSLHILNCFRAAYKASYPLRRPVISYQNIHFVYLLKKEIILLTPIFNDLDIFTHISFLDKLSELILSYFKHYKLLKSSADDIIADLVRDNYVLMYELFDECMDFGIPQLTEFSVLKDFIKLMIKPEDYYDESHVNDEINMVEKQVEAEINSSISRSAVNKISWRPKGIFYNKNEIFVNFTENLKFKFNHKIHKVVINQILGEINCKSYLSGMPNLKLGLNETVDATNSIFNNIQYHQCVDLNNLSDNTIQFIPPDGEFKLLNYQILNTNVLQPLILVKPLYRLFKRNDTYKLRIKLELVTTFKRKFSMTDIKIRIPLIVKHPSLFINFNNSLRFKTKLGIVIHSLEDESIIWKIEKLQGSMKGEMLAEFDLITEKQLYITHMENFSRGKQQKNDLFYFELSSELSKLSSGKSSTENYFTEKKKLFNKDNDNILTVEFELKNMLYSGLKVDFLRITEEQLKFQSFPWILYSVSSTGDDYSFVLADEEFMSDISEEDDNLLKEQVYKAEGEEEEEDVKEVKEEVEDDNNENNINEEELQESDQHVQSDIGNNDDNVRDHIGKFKFHNGAKLDFEEYVLSDEE